MTVIAGAALILSFAKLKENILPATFIVAVVLGALTAADPKFCVWLNRLSAIPISHHEKNGPG
jgi:hypothetical protein